MKRTKEQIEESIKLTNTMIISLKSKYNLTRKQLGDTFADNLITDILKNKQLYEKELEELEIV